MVTETERSRGPRLALLASAVVVVLIVSVVALVVVASRNDSNRSGSAAAAGAPVTTAPRTPVATSATPSISTSPVAEKSSTTRTASPTDTSASTKARDTRKPITYTVKRGDNLTVIAAWFKLHGYGDLYARNKKVIGSDPDLIRPGQRITISTAGVSTSR